MAAPDDPLLVFGPRSTTYDFGLGHPLTPRRFGPGLDLLRALGAEPGLAPEPATDAELALVHDPAYLAVIRQFSRVPIGEGSGVGHGDVPPFAGMHEASAAVAGGSLRAMEAILRGDVAHAVHPGGGLHHAMRSRAAGFCVYNDASIAIARARAAGLRVLYLDLDVHHGDGVEAIHMGDPGVVTFSLHESGRTLFPGTGGVNLGDEGPAVGTMINLPLFAGTGAEPWLAAVELLLPEIAAAFGPDLIVSQHGCDAHAWDPLAHLRVTTTAMGAAARLVDTLAHRHAGGRWLATGGGGYDAYRVVPRAWALTWLAAAHREVPAAIPTAWRERWAGEAAQYGIRDLPTRLEDDPEIGVTSEAPGQDSTAVTAALVRRLVVPSLIRHAVDAGWWSPLDPVGTPAGWSGRGGPGTGGDAPVRRAATTPDESAARTPTILPAVDRATWARLGLAPGVAGPADPAAGHALVDAALGSRDAVLVSAAVDGDLVVGLAVSVLDPLDEIRRLLALGVAAPYRRAGLARALFAAHQRQPLPGDEAGRGEAPVRRAVEITITAAERDPFHPLARDAGARAARSLLEGERFQVERAPGRLGMRDRHALVARRPA